MGCAGPGVLEQGRKAEAYAFSDLFLGILGGSGKSPEPRDCLHPSPQLELSPVPAESATVGGGSWHPRALGIFAGPCVGHRLGGRPVRSGVGVIRPRRTAAEQPFPAPKQGRGVRRMWGAERCLPSWTHGITVLPALEPALGRGEELLSFAPASPCHAKWDSAETASRERGATRLASPRLPQLWSTGPFRPTRVHWGCGSKSLCFGRIPSFVVKSPSPRSLSWSKDTLPH